MSLAMTRRGLLAGGAAAVAISGYRLSLNVAEADPFEAAKRNAVLADHERFELGWIVRGEYPRIPQHMIATDSGTLDFIRSSKVQSYSGRAAVRGCRALIVTSEQGPASSRYYWPTRVIDVLAHDDPRSTTNRQLAEITAEREASWREFRVSGSCRWRDLTTVRDAFICFSVNRCDQLEPYRYAKNGARVWMRTGQSLDGSQVFAISDERPFGVPPETGPERLTRSERVKTRRAGLKTGQRSV